MRSTIHSLLRAQVALLTCAALTFAGCSNMPPYAELFDTSPEAEGTGIVGFGLVRAAVIIAKYQATDRQREVATQRARATTRKLVARAESAERPVTRKRAPITKKSAPIAKKSAPAAQAKASKVAKPRATAVEEPASPREKSVPRKAPEIVEETPAAPVEVEAPVVEKKPARKKLPRYIAVDTVPDARSKGTKSVMIWDTQAEAIVGNNVYDVATPPRMMETVKFETYSAEYVGSGL